MRMRVEGVMRTGNSTLDRGITDLVVHQGPGGLVVYSSSGRNGGLTGYTVDAGGSARVHTTFEFPAHLTGRVSDRLILDASGGVPRLITGVDGNGLITWGLRSDMTIGGRLTLTLDQARDAFLTGGNANTLEALVTMSGGAGGLLGGGGFASQIVELRSISLEGRQFVIVADTADHAVRAYIRDPATGRLVQTDLLDAKDGLGIQTPTGMELATVNGVAYAVVISATTSSISVMQIDADGRLTPTDQVIDTGSTRFAGAQAVATVQAGAHTFVVVGGADHGVTLFLLLPDGKLMYLDTVADTAALSMANVSALALAVDGNTLRIFVGSQRDEGVTHLSVPLGELGVQRFGIDGQATRLVGSQGNDILMARANMDTLQGGGGDDILISGPGRTIMAGGAGADAFVIRAASTRVDVMDFQRGVDWLDLSDLPMLRGLGQLSITTTGTGARIVYRGTTVIVVSQDGQPLTAADLFPNGLVGPDRIPLLAPLQPIRAGEVILCLDGEGPGDHGAPRITEAAGIRVGPGPDRPALHPPGIEGSEGQHSITVPCPGDADDLICVGEQGIELPPEAPPPSPLPPSPPPQPGSAAGPHIQSGDTGPGQVVAGDVGLTSGTLDWLRRVGTGSEADALPAWQDMDRDADDPVAYPVRTDDPAAGFDDIQMLIPMIDMA